MDRSEDWRVFVHVATHKSFAAAARQLGRSPQAITRAVAALEARLGTRLLNRTTRSVSLSHDGERYLDRARNLIAELDALESPGDDAEPRGTLAITAPVLFGQLHVLPVVTAYLARHPQVNVRLALGDRIVSLADEGIDLAVRIGALADSALLARQLGYVRTVLVASPAYLDAAGMPRSLDALGKHACIALTGTTPIADRWSFDRRVIKVAPRLVVNTSQAAIDAALAGLGITRVLSYQVDRLVAADRLRIVLGSAEPAPVPVHLLSLPGVQPRLATAFADHVAAALRRRLQ
ncbi:MAG TPA: LysR substrate-binding domain-containing protein [Kofleriaceae bacterium]